MNKILYIFILLFFTCNTNAQILELPLKITPAFAGNYGELRKSHFHMGLDFRTKEKEGYRIYASESGYVRRINISRTGYGRCLYIDHPELGLTTVYAHLSKFAPHIQSHIDSVLEASQKNEIEYYPNVNEIPVTRGEVVAYSGNSGSSSGPHLHYEVRNMHTEKTINPLHYFDKLADTKKPLYSHNFLYAVDGNETKYLKSFDVKSNKGKSIIVNNPHIGIGVRVIDYMDNAPNKLGIYRISVYENEVLKYLFQMDSLDFEWQGHIKSTSDYSRPMRDVYRAFNNPCGFNVTAPNNELNGIINLDETSTKDIKVIVQDYYGNYNSSTFTLKFIKKVQTVDETEKKLFCDRSGDLSVGNFTILLPSNVTESQKKLKLFSLKNNDPSDIYRFKFMNDHDAVLNKYSMMYINEKNLEKLYLLGKYDNKKRKYLPEDDGQILTFKNIKNFGTFSLKQDFTPPYINERYSYQYGILKININDKESGVKDFDFYVNGTWRHIYYDLKTKRLVYKVHGSEKGKTNECKLTVRDLLGNEKTKTFSITF